MIEVVTMIEVETNLTCEATVGGSESEQLAPVLWLAP